MLVRTLACCLGLIITSTGKAQTEPEAEIENQTEVEVVDVDVEVEEPDAELHPIFRYPLRLRIHGGVGFASRAAPGSKISLAVVGGLQLMLPANENQSFGVGVAYLQTDSRAERRYITPGLFVENRMFGWFLMSLGVGAYVPLTEPRPTRVGISTKLGYSPTLERVINPFVVLRSDWIFDDRIVGSLTVDAGMSLHF
ncbi:MAG: hypothetical protein AAGF92_08625 [Myxococcota bacterium]